MLDPGPSRSARSCSTMRRLRARNHRQGVISHFRRAIAGVVGDHDARVGRRLQIDIVETDAVAEMTFTRGIFSSTRRVTASRVLTSSASASWAARINSSSLVLARPTKVTSRSVTPAANSAPARAHGLVAVAVGGDDDLNGAYLWSAAWTFRSSLRNGSRLSGSTSHTRATRLGSLPVLSHRASPCLNPGSQPRKTRSEEGRQETAPTSPTPAQLPMTGHLATSTPRNGRGLAIRSRLWLVRPAYPAIRPPSIAVSGGEPATSGSSGLYGHSIRTPLSLSSPFCCRK